MPRDSIAYVRAIRLALSNALRTDGVADDDIEWELARLQDTLVGMGGQMSQALSAARATCDSPAAALVSHLGDVDLSGCRCRRCCVARRAHYEESGRNGSDRHGGYCTVRAAWHCENPRGCAPRVR
ncbi:MAG: hypothetical protein O2800_02935 [Planctomycetota bacterium]|nr:hypothetical protein [Planctomycetota bacterium]